MQPDGRRTGIHGPRQRRRHERAPDAAAARGRVDDEHAQHRPVVRVDRAARPARPDVHDGSHDLSVVFRHEQVAVGGQVVSLQGLRGRYDDVFLPLYGAHQAQNAAVALAAVEAFAGTGVLDDEDGEVDLASQALQVWQNAVKADPRLEQLIPAMPGVVFGTKSEGNTGGPGGVLVYLRTADGNDALAWVDERGRSVTESQFAVLRAAACGPNTPALPRRDDHHDLVSAGVTLMTEENRSVGGQLGRPSGARYKTYERLKRFLDESRGTLYEHEFPALPTALEELYKHPLYSSATDTLNRRLRGGVGDRELARLVLALRDDDRLCIVHDEGETREPKIVCSLGLV